MTPEELAEQDGRDGRPAYVAVSGVIYDVSASDLWRDGRHLDQHQAGQDLTEALKSAPHVRTVVERFPSVGRLTTTPPTPPSSSSSSVKLLGIAIGVTAVLLIGWLVLR
ncbi:MAG TPA: cytochrome b5 domain-containing protein [Geopsychrobacteraceae bacterium]|jgi:predicted heme/steroid binding protein